MSTITCDGCGFTHIDYHRDECPCGGPSWPQEREATITEATTVARPGVVVDEDDETAWDVVLRLDGRPDHVTTSASCRALGLGPFALPLRVRVRRDGPDARWRVVGVVEAEPVSVANPGPVPVGVCCGLLRTGRCDDCGGEPMAVGVMRGRGPAAAPPRPAPKIDPYRPTKAEVVATAAEMEAALRKSLDMPPAVSPEPAPIGNACGKTVRQE